VKAAVVSSFDRPPAYADIADPIPRGPDDLVVEVLAAGLHPRVRSQADGSHYTSTDELPLVPGIDGVGRDPEGRSRYFVLPDTTLGSMAERTVIDTRRSVLLPPGADPVALAAAMNPAMSSWVALRRRIDFSAGQGVLVLGATGNAGRLAVEVARLLGAGRIVAAGRSAERLAALGAVETITFDELAGAADVDVVLDYVWGEPTARALVDVVTARADRGKPLTWIEVGSVAGSTTAIPSAVLRAARLQLVGSGQGSVPTRDIVAELAALAEEVPRFDVDARAVPLSAVTHAWVDAATSRQRIVITPRA